MTNSLFSFSKLGLATKTICEPLLGLYHAQLTKAPSEAKDKSKQAFRAALLTILRSSEPPSYMEERFRPEFYELQRFARSPFLNEPTANLFHYLEHVIPLMELTLKAQKKALETDASNLNNAFFFQCQESCPQRTRTTSNPHS